MGGMGGRTDPHPLYENRIRNRGYRRQTRTCLVCLKVFSQERLSHRPKSEFLHNTDPQLAYALLIPRYSSALTNWFPYSTQRYATLLIRNKY